jgi:hypothetical protein
VEEGGKEGRREGGREGRREGGKEGRREGGRREGEISTLRPDHPTDDEWVVALSSEDALSLMKKKYGDSVTPEMLEQDPDVLDTWFSSALFPISTLGWPWVFFWSSRYS